MTGLDGQIAVRYEFGGTARGSDGFEIEFRMDDGLRSWWQIVRWNLHYCHWRALALNFRDLFTKVVWRKLWRHS